MGLLHFIARGNPKVTHNNISFQDYLENTKEINEIFDNEFGIKISPGSNFMLSVFNTYSNDRNLYFDGAIPLHEFIYSLHIFCDEYISKDNKDNIYILSIFFNLIQI
jgi:hypothetical protein